MDYVLPKGVDCESLTDNHLLHFAFIEPWPPPVLEVKDVIGHANTKIPNLSIISKWSGMILITTLNKFGSHVVCVISSDLEPDISWGEIHCYEDSPILSIVKLFH